MSDASISKCDGCGSTVMNSYEAPGWLAFSGSITRSVGRYSKKGGHFETAFIEKKVNKLDFCSVECLVKALDQKAPIHDSKAGRAKVRPGC